MEGIERKTYSAAVIEGVRKRARVFVGDSIVRKTDRVLNKGDDVVVCLPGAKIEAITERVKNIVGSGGRRKLSKQFDRDEMGKLVTQSMEIDKGAGGDGNYDVLRPMSAPSALEESLGRESEVLPGSSPAQETSDDILAKYRNPKPAETVDQPSNQRQSRLPSAVDDDDDSIAYDPVNLETCKAFVDAKKKLRLVLSTLDPQMVPMMHGVMPQRTHHHHDNELIAFLQILLAEALNLQDHDAIAQLHETIRCLRQFETHETKKLLKTMKEEYRNRSPYISYLVRCRQALLATHACLERMLCRAQKDKVACNKYFLSVFVRLFLEKMERSLMKFIADFQKFTVADEKTDLLEKYLVYLHKQMEQDSTWQGASEKQVEEARVYVERHVMSHIYTHAMFPNGEGDFMRDQILHKHMGKLAQVITPNHKDLRIAKMYHYECPWPAAQAEIYMINVYKTPADKLQCAVRCASIIMNLLSMANEKSVPAADDFMPVLIYILIKANPPSLLSTVQYVSSFYEKRLFGEEQYWWTQLTSAIEFIKTMDYGS
ncbi:GTPase-activating protein and VPS9 domain-containing protein 1 [Lamellibrachia satsuma]|nr:GTPase-activating protein and VPS9 domain-containing protein 1 [Lamellibrachia satsuma]